MKLFEHVQNPCVHATSPTRSASTNLLREPTRMTSHQVARHRGKEGVWSSALIKAISLILMHIMNEKLSKCYAEVCLNLAHTFVVPQRLILAKDVISVIQRGNS